MQWLSFPKDFKWCAATAAHQIEGNNKNSDWWLWENQSGTIKNGDNTEIAADHWNKLKEDIDLLGQLNLNTYRLSIEWAKIEPTQGQWDPEAVAHYQTEIRMLSDAGIAPLITLQHFTLPQWVAQNGGWNWNGIADAFAKYSEFVYTQIAPQVQDWITLNEPMVLVFAGYLEGIFPPGLKGKFPDIIAPITGMLKAHAAVYKKLHLLAEKSDQPIRIGFAHHLRKMYPANSLNPLDLLAAHYANEAWNWAFPNAIKTGRLIFSVPFTLSANIEIPDLKGTQDFFGLNYYSSDKIHYSFSDGFKRLDPKTELHEKNITDLGWTIDPKGFYDILKQTKNRFPDLSILITENGIADATDFKRIPFIHDHLIAILHAIDKGAKIEGYCHWSLIDNFEWAEGYTPRFGLFEVNYSTLERTPRPSATYLSKIAKDNGFIGKK